MEKISSSRMMPIRDVIYHRIRATILNGELKPGERLTEEALARELGISRTPVREALRKLEVDKLVSHHPHRGVIVSEVFVDELEDLYEIREYVETIIAKHAARNATPDDIGHLSMLLDKLEAATSSEEASDYSEQYNLTIAKLSGCPTIINLEKLLRDALARITVSTYLMPERRSTAQTEHREIVAAIAAGDAKLAQKLTKSHIRNAAKRLKSLEHKPS